ncbi:MAG: DNA cytosine methyltransferase [Bacteriovoracaceae bacterium]
MNKQTSFNFIDLFCGAGGLSCGLQMAGHHCVLGIDSNKVAMETFKINHPQAAAYTGSITEITKESIDEITNCTPIHLVVGGPPCQGFSTVGKGDPKDERNSLMKHFVRIVSEINPYFFIMENVTGLLAKKNEKLLHSILHAFYQIGYNVNVKVLESQHYGVPEKRKRTIFLGSRINETIPFPKPLFSYANVETVDKALKNLKNSNRGYYNHDLDQAQIKKPIDKLRIHHIPEGKGIRYQADEEKYLPKKLKLKIDWNTIKENRLRQTRYQRLDGKKPAPTILTSRHSYYHPQEDRFLTAREAAKLQSFPNDFIFKGNQINIWRQIGNAVPPLLAKALGEQLITLWQEYIKLNRSGKTNRVIKNSKHEIHKIRGRAFIYHIEL